MLFHEYQLIKPYCLQYKLFPYIWLNCRRHWRKLIGGRLWLLCNKARFARALERRWLLLICVPRWHYPRSGHQCRLKNPLHYRILNRQWHTDSDGGWHHCRSLKTETDLQETVSVPGFTRQCPVEQHCQFVVPTDSDGCFKSVGSWLKPAVLSKPTLSVHGSNRQCCSKYQCWFMDQTSSAVVSISVGS